MGRADVPTAVMNLWSGVAILRAGGGLWCLRLTIDGGGRLSSCLVGEVCVVSLRGFLLTSNSSHRDELEQTLKW